MAFADFLQDYDEVPKGSKSGKSSPITDQLLDNLYQVESSKRPNVVNEKSGALGGYQFMPDTVKMLSKKGINFDPMNADQSREAARSYLSMLVDQNGGDIRKALAQYGGFKEKDPTSYVNAVLGGAPSEKAANQSSFASFLNDEDMPHATTPSTAGAGRGSYAGYNMAQDVANTAPAKPVEAPNTPTGFGLNVLSKAQELKHAIIPAAANVADVTIGSALPLVAGAITQPLARLGTTPERAEQIAQNVSGYLSQPFGKALGVTNQPGYANSDVNNLMAALGNGISALGEKANITPQSISKVTGLPIQDVRYGLNILGLGVAPEAAGLAGKLGRGLEVAKAELSSPEMVNQGNVEAGSVGAAAVPTETTIKQALTQIKNPELKQELANIPVNELNMPAMQRHIEADSLPVPIRLTKGQSTGDIVDLSHEQNLKGKNTELAYRFDEQNKALAQNLREFKEQVAPEAFGSRMIDHGDAVMNAYKELDNQLNKDINEKYQALRDAAGGDFPVDAPKLFENVQNTLKKELLSDEAPKGQFNELKRLAEEGKMTFENYLSMRRNLGEVARTAQDGTTRRAASLMIDELEKLPLQEGAAKLKPLADEARAAARSRFQRIDADPAYKAIVNEKIEPEDFLKKFVVNGKNSNLQEMLKNIGSDNVARQHISAGALSYLADRAGISDISKAEGNFTQNGFNNALKKMEEANTLPLIFGGETSEGLRTLGNVASYTQFQPRGHFINNSNTLVAKLAEKAKNVAGKGVEYGLNAAVPYMGLGTSLMKHRENQALQKEVEQYLKAGAGLRAKPNLMDLGKK